VADLPAFACRSGKSSSIASKCQPNYLTVLGNLTLDEEFIKVGLEFCFITIFIARALTFLVHRRLWPLLILSRRAFGRWLICKDSAVFKLVLSQFNLLLLVTALVDRYLDGAILIMS